MKSPQKLHTYYIRNRQAIDAALKRIDLTLREAIATGDQKTVSVFVPLYALLLGAWAECRLLELLYEPNGFDEADRKFIRKESSQITQWRMAVERAFRKQYKISKAPLLRHDILSFSARTKYEALQEMLENDLKRVIEIRNKLAHGQWAYPLNAEGTDIAHDQYNAIKNENLLSLRYKKKLLALLSSAIQDLIVSKETFDRDFEDHYRKIAETQRNLKTRSYQQYAEQQAAKYERGKVEATKN